MFKSILSLFMALVMFISSGICSLFENGESIRIVVPEKWEMQPGNSRTLECVFGNKVSDRVVKWSVSPSDVA